MSERGARRLRSRSAGASWQAWDRTARPPLWARVAAWALLLAAGLFAAIGIGAVVGLIIALAG